MIKNINDSLKLVQKNNRAFTIVELLIVIVIIGILAAITIVSYTGITKRAGESSVQAELSNASKKLAIYYTLNGTYPTNIDQSTGCPTAPTPDNNNCIKFGSGTTFSYNYKTASTYGLSATKGSAAYQTTESSSPIAFAPSFVKNWGGANADYGYDLIQTSDGGYAVTGYTSSFGAGSADVLLAKYDTSGNLSWSKTWGGANTDYGYDLIQTSDGGYAVTGETASYGAGIGDMFLVKFDASGNFGWNKLWGGVSNDLGRSLIQTSDGGYAVTGYAQSFGAGSGDAFLVKYDANGNLSWNKLWGGTGADSSYSLIQTSDGGYVITGGTPSYGAGIGDLFIIKYDINGNLNWNKLWGGSADETGYDLVQTSDGGYAVAGHTSSFGAGSMDSALVKYDATGNLSWSKTWGGGSNDISDSLVQAGDGGYVLSGQTGSYGAGGGEVFLIKYDVSGNLSWNKTWGGASSDLSKSLIKTNDGGYAITGYTGSYGVGNGDLFLAKYDISGNINNCSSPMCQSPVATVTSPSATVTTPSATVTTPTATVTTPAATVTAPTATVTTVVAP